ncbi:MAG: hypothetical protein LBK53_06455 [Heliobacteriaceae bacterium]|jgi:hypothetical protein|nr:hypothetical protein [Heliobacteriaceae bacterium]
MTIGTVQSSEYRTNPCLPNVVNATTTGVITGFAAKYILPLTIDEKADINAAEITENAGRKVVQNKAAEFKRSAVLSPAEDIFVKMAEKEAKIPCAEEIQKAAKSLKEQEIAKFNDIIKSAQKAADSMAKKALAFEAFSIKRIRPTLHFLLAGAGAGFCASVCHNVFRTKVEKQSNCY